MTRIEQEKQTVRKMIELYCRHHLKQDTMPDEYQHLAVLAGSLLLAILAMVETATSELYQTLILIRHCVLFKMMTAIELYHLANGMLFSLNLAHTGREDTKNPPYRSDTEESFVIL